MVVSVHHLATDAGVQILKEGGNAIDAAVATGFALAVVHPAAGNIGGGGFMLVHFAAGNSAFIDYRERAPLAATANMYLDAKGNPTNAIKIIAIETQDFLGDVFLCRDPATGDILHARMYASVETILDWIAAHPGSQDACDIVVRYSPFNNYPDFITSRANGVKVNVSEGAGFGRVVDATLFDISVLNQ